MPVDTPVRYSVIIPVYNEEAVLHMTYQRLTAVMEGLGEPYELLFVNDGSSDQTQTLIESLCEWDADVKLINFSRNFGHQVAISAGMDHASGDAVIILDADLQDPPELIPEMVDRWRQGYEVVYAQRTNRQGETWFKRWTAAAFYRMLRRLTDVDIPVDTGDFRLIDRKVCEVMRTIHEKNRFIRGLVSWAGFRQTAVEYEREGRFAGETKYPLRRMLKLSMDAITSFSEKPLQLAVYMGLAFSVVSFSYLVYTVSEKLLFDHTVPGWTSIVSICLFFNGVVLLVLGIIGEYIGRIYEETRNRPLYIVGSHVGLVRKRMIIHHGARRKQSMR